MSRSRQVAVVFEVSPETEEYEREWTIIDVNLPKARRRDAKEYCWLPGEVRETVSMCGLPDALWGSEADAPADVLAGGKFVALGREEWYRSGNPFDGYESDSEFVVESYRKI